MKSNEVIRTIIHQFSRPGAFVLDSSLGIEATAKDCFSEPYLQTFSGCNMDSCCVRNVMMSRLQMSPEQFLNKLSDTLGEKQLQHAERFYVWKSSAVKILQLKRLKSVPWGLQPVHIFIKLPAVSLPILSYARPIWKDKTSTLYSTVKDVRLQIELFLAQSTSFSRVCYVWCDRRAFVYQTTSRCIGLFFASQAFYKMTL